MVISPSGPVPDAYAPVSTNSGRKMPIAAVVVPCVLVVVIIGAVITGVTIVIRRKRYVQTNSFNLIYAYHMHQH